MNVCAVCAAAMSEEETFCSHCGAAVAPPAKPFGAWRRVITGIIGFPVVTSGTLLIAFGAFSLAKGCGDGGDGWGRGICEVVSFIYLAFGVGIALLGAPFALAAIVPFGTARRILVSLGAAASGAAFFGIGLANEGMAVAIVVAVLVAFGLFHLTYQIAR
jgi:hypothetical protein